MPDQLTDFTGLYGATVGALPAANADASVVARVEDRLEELAALAEQLNLEDGFRFPTLNYPIPETFCLSVIVPVFNESATVHRILARVRAIPMPKQIVIVDDGSTDGTRELLEPYADLPDVRVILQPENRGKGAAVRAGFQAAQGDVVVVQDADLEYDPRDIPQLIQPILCDDADVVYGSRFQRESRHTNSSPVHRLGNWGLTQLSNLTTGLRLTDMETCYKAVRRPLIQSLPLKQDRFGFEPEITAKIARRQWRIREIPIRYEARPWQEGKKIGVRDGLQAIYCILRYAWGD